MFSGKEKFPGSGHQEKQVTKKEQINVSSGRIGERLVIRTTTLTGQGLRYTLTRPFRSAEPRPSRPNRPQLLQQHRKSRSDGAFKIPAATNFWDKPSTTAAVSDSSLLRSSSVDSYNGFFDEVYSNTTKRAATARLSEKQEKFQSGSERNVRFATSAEEESAEAAAARRRSFARRFREQRPVDYEPFRRTSLPSVSAKPSDGSLPPISPVNREVNEFLNNIENCAHPLSRKSRRPVRKRAVFYERPQQLQATAPREEVRFRRRDAGADGELKSAMPSRCLSIPQSLNRSIPCVYESSQFTAVRSTSYIDGLPEPSLPSRTRTAVVGPNTAHRSREGPSTFDYGPIDKRGDVRSYCSSDIARTYTSPPTPLARYDCGDPPPYYSHRRSTHPEDGPLYPICSTPLSRSPRCEFPQGGSPIDGAMLPRPSRPRDLRVTPVVRSGADDSNVTSTSKKHSTSGLANTARGGGGAPIVVDEVVAMNNNSASSSKKMMVAPQPQNTHHRERNDSSYKNSNPQRRQSMGAVVPAYSIPVHSGECWRSRDRDRESPCSSSDQQLVVDDRRNTKNGNNDLRVAVLEQRVRELESAIINSHIASSPSIPTTSFIIPVIGNSKNSSRILRSASGQFVVSAATSPTTQQLMAQEVVDKEIEVERLQSQLRKCYSRMELRQVQYDEEVNAFRRESEEAKAQLAKVKARLGDLEKECVAYREKAMAVDANRNSVVASSLEKISAQEREIATLKGELERNLQLVKDFERLKKDNEFLELQNEALNATLDSKEATIRDLEDNIFAMKMDASCKLESGSATPKADAFSLFDVETTKFFNDSKERTPTASLGTKGDQTPSSSGAAAAANTSEQTEPPKESTQQTSSSSSSSGSENGKSRLSPTTSKLIRKQLSTTLECRLLAKCLKDVAAKAISGDAPSVNRLLGCRSDSMSESEPEPVMTDSSAMSLQCAERHIRKTAEDMERVEKDLNSLRESFVEYYQKKIADELKEDESCRIQ